MAAKLLTTSDRTLQATSEPKQGNANMRLHLSGTFGAGATVTIYTQLDGLSTSGPGSDGWVAQTGGVFTAATDQIINLTRVTAVRATLSSGDGDTSVICELV